MDLSLRNSGLVFIDENKIPILFEIIKSEPNPLSYLPDIKNKPWPKLDEEYLLVYNNKKILEFVGKCFEISAVDGVGIEGLSFGSKSPFIDLIDANFWMTIVGLIKKYPDLPVGRLPVNLWRNNLTTIEERREAKIKYGKKGLKQVVVDKTPKDIVRLFEDYVEINKMAKDQLFDLCDAYSIACYRLDID